VRSGSPVIISVYTYVPPADTTTTDTTTTDTTPATSTPNSTP
jgi:hypothetical protein